MNFFANCVEYFPLSYMCCLVYMPLKYILNLDSQNCRAKIYENIKIYKFILYICLKRSSCLSLWFLSVCRSQRWWNIRQIFWPSFHLLSVSWGTCRWPLKDWLDWWKKWLTSFQYFLSVWTFQFVYTIYLREVMILLSMKYLFEKESTVLKAVV